jgi:hypothetical protein
VGAAEGFGEPVPACHVPGQVGGVLAGHPGGCDIWRPGSGAAEHWHGVGSGAEGCVGHADHRNAELGVGVDTEARPSVRVQIGAGPGPGPLVRIAWLLER